MSLRTILAALNAQLITLPGFNDAQCAWPGKPFASTTGVAYLAPKITALVRKRLGGSGQYGTREISGTYQVSTFQPVVVGAAEDAAMGVADSILALFEGGTTLTTTDSWMIRMDTPTAMPSIIDGQWVHIPVLCPWFVTYDP